MQVSTGLGGPPAQIRAVPRRRYWIDLALFAMAMINYTDREEAAA